MEKPTSESLNHMFSYDPSEPLALRWKNPLPKATKCKKGEIAGYWHVKGSQYAAPRRFVTIGNRMRLVHLIVWTMHKGEWPTQHIHTIDGQWTDLRIDNLTTKVPVTEFTPDMTKQERREIYHRRYKNSFSESDWKERKASDYIKWCYGITMEEYEELLFKQAFMCAICHSPETRSKEGNVMRLSVDHCHKTGKIRGLLCHNCNTGLGKFKDDKDIIENALKYIQLRNS